MAHSFNSIDAKNVDSTDFVASSRTPRSDWRIAGVGSQRLHVGYCCAASFGHCARDFISHAEE